MTSQIATNSFINSTFLSDLSPNIPLHNYVLKSSWGKNKNKNKRPERLQDDILTAVLNDATMLITAPGRVLFFVPI